MASEERMIALKLEANKVGQFVHTIELPPKEYAFQRMAYSICMDYKKGLTPCVVTCLS